MGIEILNEWEVVYGASTLVVVIISWIIGIKIILKYFEHRQNVLITVGLTWIFLTSIWWKGAIIFISIIFEIDIDPFIFLAMGNIIMPIALLFWIYSFTTLAYQKYHSKMLSIYSVIVAIYLIVFIIFLSIDPSLIGEYTGTFSTRTSLFVIVFQVFALLTFLITGIFFAQSSMNSENEEIKWKGKFLLLAFITFTTASILEVARVDDINITTLIITKLIFITSAIFYYLGFFLPEGLKSRLIKS